MGHAHGIQLGAQLPDPLFDGRRVAAAADDRRGAPVDDDALRLPELAHLDGLEGEAEIVRDRLTVGQDRDVLEHSRAPLAELRCDDRDRGEATAQLVGHERLQRIALDHLGDHEQRPACLRDLIEHRTETLPRGQLLVGEQDERIVEHRLAARLVGGHLLRG